MLLAALWSLGWVGPHQAVSDSPEEAQMGSSMLSYWTLPKFPIIFSSFSPSVKWDDKCPWGKVTISYVRMGWS